MPTCEYFDNIAKKCKYFTKPGTWEAMTAAFGVDVVLEDFCYNPSKWSECGAYKNQKQGK